MSSISLIVGVALTYSCAPSRPGQGAADARTPCRHRLRRAARRRCVVRRVPVHAIWLCATTSAAQRSSWTRAIEAAVLDAPVTTCSDRTPGARRASPISLRATSTSSPFRCVSSTRGCRSPPPRARRSPSWQVDIRYKEHNETVKVLTGAGSTTRWYARLHSSLATASASRRQGRWNWAVRRTAHRAGRAHHDPHPDRRHAHPAERRCAGAGASPQSAARAGRGRDRPISSGAAAFLWSSGAWARARLRTLSLRVLDGTVVDGAGAAFGIGDPNCVATKYPLTANTRGFR